MIRVRINGEEQDLDEGLSVRQLIERHTGRLDPLGVAVARNKAVVPRSSWADTSVEDGDEYELVGIMQGG